MRKSTNLASAVLCLGLFVAACAADSGETSTTVGADAASTTGAVVATGESGAEGVLLGSVSPFDVDAGAAPPPETLEAIMQVVQQRVVSESEPRLVSSETAKWENAALDCPAMSELADTIPTEGLDVRVEVDGVTYHVRVAESGEVRMCALVVEGVPSSLPLPPGTPPTTMGSPTG